MSKGGDLGLMKDLATDMVERTLITGHETSNAG
jgi:hypothetical protein